MIGFELGAETGRVGKQKVHRWGFEKSHPKNIFSSWRKFTFEKNIFLKNLKMFENLLSKIFLKMFEYFFWKCWECQSSWLDDWFLVRLKKNNCYIVSNPFNFREYLCVFLCDIVCLKDKQRNLWYIVDPLKTHVLKSDSVFQNSIDTWSRLCKSYGLADSRCNQFKVPLVEMEGASA